MTENIIIIILSINKSGPFRAQREELMDDIFSRSGYTVEKI